MQREERIVSLQELKEELFLRAIREKLGYIQARDRWGLEGAEPQRWRFVAVYQVILDTDLDQDFKEYEKMMMRENKEFEKILEYKQAKE